MLNVKGLPCIALILSTQESCIMMYILYIDICTHNQSKHKTIYESKLKYEQNNQIKLHNTCNRFNCIKYVISIFTLYFINTHIKYYHKSLFL